MVTNFKGRKLFFERSYTIEKANEKENLENEKEFEFAAVLVCIHILSWNSIPILVSRLFEIRLNC